MSESNLDIFIKKIKYLERYHYPFNITLMDIQGETSKAVVSSELMAVFGFSSKDIKRFFTKYGKWCDQYPKEVILTDDVFNFIKEEITALTFNKNLKEILK